MSRFLITADWDNNAPHLTAQAKKDLWDSIPAYQKDARTKGIPQLGAGVIFPVPEDELLVDAFEIPRHWPRGYGLDVGWNRTAAIWGARNPDTDVLYLYDEHYRAEADPKIHGAFIAQRGVWMPGRIDPAARGRSQKDGEKLIKLYRKAIYCGDKDDQEKMLHAAQMLKPANNAVETGLYDQLMAMQSGLFKVLRGRCPNWLAERRLYRRDERGHVIKKFDHAMDAGRYLFASGIAWLVPAPAAPRQQDPVSARFGSGGSAAEGGLAWMGV